MSRSKKLPVWIEARGGLSFGCTRCGACCTGAAGYVWVGLDEIERLAAALGLDRDGFGRRYLRRVGARLSLLERENGDCVFWARGVGCTVYAARPTQCRTYPFWPEAIRSDAAWRDEATRCPGIGERSGRRFAPEEILELAGGEGET